MMYPYENGDLYPIATSRIDLKNKELWSQFHELQTEMIITKSGRRMFPSLQVEMANLDPRAHYCVYLDMVPISKCRFKYSSSGGWTPAGNEDVQYLQTKLYLHPDSPSTGDHWMSQTVSFGRVKLTNSSNPPNGHMVLSSMHKYQPKIVIVKTSDPRHISWAPSIAFAFPETLFIAVTAYQNDKITKLKIDNNPFAKGFRENGQSKCKKRKIEECVSNLLSEEQLSNSTKRSHICSSHDSDSTSSGSPPPTTTTIKPEEAPVMNNNYNYSYPYNYPYFYWGASYFYPPPMFVVAPPQNLTLKGNVLESPRKLTDFSIRSIIGQ